MGGETVKTLLVRFGLDTQAYKSGIADIKKQAALAGWTLDAALTETVIRGWRSFKAEWVTKIPVTPNRLAGAI